MDSSEFLQNCLLLDLETSLDGEIQQIGALFRGQVFVRKGRFRLETALAELDHFASAASHILGHNLLGHDMPVLRAAAPSLALHRKPVVDTLYLSPLAFPQNPYHRLVKGYKLVHDSANDPVADARLAGELFGDEWQAFAAMKQARQGDLPAFYRFCFQAQAETAGLAQVFAALGIPAIEAATAVALWQQPRYQEKICRSALRELAQENLQRPALAYALAWLSVAGGNSVPAPWARYSFPESSEILRRLRELPCADPKCAYCRVQHNPAEQLQRYFGFGEFRPRPAAPDGGSLQQRIIEAGMADRPHLAILPTGGGKSLCFQLPALTRYRRRGVLTVVISPLQALMKDQVDGLIKRTGTPFADALYGMLTPPERGQVLERIRLGDTAILYVSPEQLRNKSFREAIALREIGCWVFDEAHCLSKWGHDFRPDYLYAARFIREFAQKYRQSVPPIACFTATAKQDVIAEIRGYFQAALGQELILFEGGVKRDNLDFQVQAIAKPEKYSQVHSLLQQCTEGCAIVYAATQNGAEELADFLATQPQPIAAKAFHAGLDTPVKREIQEQFIAGEIPVICATNAFGMGIDKDNVRLVIHADIPGSLENYLQEAGRAGRDRQPAECVLLYCEEDIEKQFQLLALSQLSQRDISQLLRGIHRVQRKPRQTVVVTAGDLLLNQETEISFDINSRLAETKVKIAVAWLERAGFLERNQNSTQIFQGKPLVNLEQARERVETLKLTASAASDWLRLFEALLNVDMDAGISAEHLAETARIAALPDSEQTASQRVIRILQEMAAQGFISAGMQLSAFVPRSSRTIFEKICALDKALLDRLREDCPDAASGGWLDLSLRQVNQALREQGQDSHLELLRILIRSLAYDGKGLAGKQGSLYIHFVGQDAYRVRLQRDWPALARTADLRRAVAEVVLQILGRKSAGTQGSDEVLITFDYTELIQAIKQDLAISGEIQDHLAAVERGLLFLHEIRAIILQQGLAVFRQAMTLQLAPEAAKRRYSKGDYEPLQQHYEERQQQIHIINEYARLARQDRRQAAALVEDYFGLERKAFLGKYFKGRKEILERATSVESYRRIVDSLNHPAQIAIVTAPEEGNALVLAGPGSGKTRVVVHRCAYLLRVKRVPPRSILVLCFNRHAALSLRQRLTALVGDDARGVTVQTYHGLALRLSGVSLVDRRRDNQDFDQMIRDATALLRGEKAMPGWDADELRERLLAGYRHILVDEYQDIDQGQYELISAIAGRTENDPEAKLSLLAVGDDDQNIYSFRGADVRFIRQFQQDYQAQVYYLLDNYRSTRHIIEVSNSLIAHNRERMKTEHPIRINPARAADPPGGRWHSLDAVAQGRVQILEVADALHQAAALVAELRRWRELDASFQWSDCAVLAYQWETLMPFRALCEHHRIPVSWALDGLPSLSRIREIAAFLDAVRAGGSLNPAQLAALLPAADNPWLELVREIVAAWREEAGEEAAPASHILEFCHDLLRDYRRDPQWRGGVFCATIHRAKGLEFRYVLIPDGASGRNGEEENRRQFYVAMTRARENLLLCQRRDLHSPYIPLLQGELCFRAGISGDKVPQAVLSRRFEVLGFEDLFLDYAGRQAPEHPIHAALAALQPGSALFPQRQGEILSLADAAGIMVAQLSKSARETWASRWDKIERITVLALARRDAEDSGAEFRAKLRCSQWEVPVVEVAYR